MPVFLIEIVLLETEKRPHDTNNVANYSLSQFESLTIRFNKLFLKYTRLVIAPECNDNDCTEYIYKHDINPFVIQDFTIEFYDDFKLTNYAVGKFEGKS